MIMFGGQVEVIIVFHFFNGSLNFPPIMKRHTKEIENLPYEVCEIFNSCDHHTILNFVL